MANIYKNAGRRGAVAPGGAAPIQTEVDPVTETVNEPITAEKVADISGPAVLSGIRKTQKPKKKNASFYLSVSTIEQLSEMAEQEGMSASELLDNILKNIFGN